MKTQRCLLRTRLWEKSEQLHGKSFKRCVWWVETIE